MFYCWKSSDARASEGSNFFLDFGISRHLFHQILLYEMFKSAHWIPESGEKWTKKALKI